MIDDRCPTCGKGTTRTREQNKRMWAMLDEIAAAVPWCGQQLISEEWKDLFTALLKGQKIVPGLEGGFVVLGTSTRRLKKQEMSDLMELMAAFGAERSLFLDREVL